MTISLEESLEILKKIILDKATHEHYERVNHLSQKYKALISGHELHDFLQRFDRREEDEEFKQRKRLVELTAPSTCEKIINPFYRISRMDNIYKRLQFEEIDRSKDLEEKINKFWGMDSLDHYMETRFVELSMCDPNAFIVVEFDDFDNNVETPTPFPLEISSEQAINYNYHNHHLKYLVAKFPIKIIGTIGGKEKEYDTDKYLMYLENDIIEVIKLDSRDKRAIFEETIEIGKDRFLFRTFQPKGGRVQAFRVGYKHDLVTNGETFVSPLHPALSRLMRIVKNDSELDLSVSLHVFPQKIQYVSECKGESLSLPCDKGHCPSTNEQCRKCDGTGFDLTHTTASDILTVPLPEFKEEEIVPIDKRVHYVNQPTEVVKFLNDFSIQLEQQAMRDVFVSEAFNKNTVTQTATEAVINMESVNDTLHPFANKFSELWTGIVGLIAKFSGIDSGLKVIHSFPKDFKLKNTKVLIEDLKSAKDAGASTFIIEEIENDIASKTYVDDPLSLTKFQIKKQHKPFKGKTIEEIQYIISIGLATEEEKVLWASFDTIIEEIEREQFDESIDFYQLAYNLRVELVEAKVQEFLEKINGDNAVEFPQPEEEDEVDVEDEDNEEENEDE